MVNIIYKVYKRKGLKMIKTKLINIINSTESLNKLAEKDLPIQTSFKITDILFTIEKEVNNYNQQKNKIIQKYGTTEDGINYNFTDENKIEFIQELEELNNHEVNLAMEKINLPDDINISANVLYSLNDFIERG